MRDDELCPEQHRVHEVCEALVDELRSLGLHALCIVSTVKREPSYTGSFCLADSSDTAEYMLSRLEQFVDEDLDVDDDEPLPSQLN